MKQNINFIQPFLLSAFHSQITDSKFITTPSRINLFECSFSDESTNIKDNDLISIPFIPSGNSIWIIGFEEYDSPSSIYYMGSFDHITTVQLKQYHHYFCVSFDDDIFYLNQSLPEISSPVDMRNTLIEKVVAADFKEYDLINNIKTTDSFDSHVQAFVTYLETFCSPFLFKQNAMTLHDLIKTNHGCISVNELASISGYSLRHINRIFTGSFGYGPKEYCKYVRFQKVLYEILSMPLRNNSEFIQNIGYSDQAHFQREFKMFMGMTPKQYISLLCQ